MSPDAFVSYLSDRSSSRDVPRVFLSESANAPGELHEESVCCHRANAEETVPIQLHGYPNGAIRQCVLHGRELKLGVRARNVQIDRGDLWPFRPASNFVARHSG